MAINSQNDQNNYLWNTNNDSSDFSFLQENSRPAEITVGTLDRITVARSLINKFRMCPVGMKDVNGQQFHSACEDLIRRTLKDEFDDGISLKTEQRSIDIIYNKNKQKHIKIRKYVDLSLRIDTPKNPNSIWKKFSTEYECRQIIFECKNYSLGNPISRDEVFQLFDYLHPKRRGKLGIIICRNKDNITNDAISVINRIRDDGYKIILIGQEEIYKWLDDFSKNKVSNFFCDMDHN